MTKITEIIFNKNSNITQKDKETLNNYILELEKQNEVLKMTKNALESDLINAALNLDMLLEVTADIPLDRLKEICDAVRLMRKDNGKWVYGGKPFA
ncbi:MAG TPA: hypothetical protein VFD25_05595 [Clostridia bacterium]|nr:hypothetical protein [Clostridia bacterium]